MKMVWGEFSLCEWKKVNMLIIIDVYVWDIIDFFVRDFVLDELDFVWEL